MTDKPSVLFVCVHNAGRSQMAAAYLAHLSGGDIEVRSAGSAPGERVNPAAVEAMAEEGIDISAQTPKVLTTDAVQASDVSSPWDAGIPARSFRASATRTGNSTIRPARGGLGSTHPRRDQNTSPSADRRTVCPPKTVT